MSSMELQNTVKEALNALYHHPDDSVRMQADRWLQDFQRTIDAWQVHISSLRFSISCSVFLFQIIKEVSATHQTSSRRAELVFLPFV